MIVTLTGPNDFLRSRELEGLSTAFVADQGSLALERIDGEEANFARMEESLKSLPFLSAKKMVILREPSRQKAWAEHIARTLADTPESTVAVIIEPKLDKRQNYYKILKKQTDFREFGDLESAGLIAWAQERTRAAGGKLTSADARLLIDRVGSNQQMLQNELEKLLAFDPIISRVNIEQLTERLPQSSVFELLEAAFAGRPARTISLYQEQRALRVEPQAIIAMLAWQLHVLAIVKTALPRDADDIARAAKLNPFVVRKTLSLARQLPAHRLKLLIAELLRLDNQLKTAAIDTDEALQLYLLRVSSAAN